MSFSTDCAFVQRFLGLEINYALRGHQDISLTNHPWLGNLEIPYQRRHVGKEETG